MLCYIYPKKEKRKKKMFLQKKKNNIQYLTKISVQTLLNLDFPKQ